MRALGRVHAVVRCAAEYRVSTVSTAVSRRARVARGCACQLLRVGPRAQERPFCDRATSCCLRLAFCHVNQCVLCHELAVKWPTISARERRLLHGLQGFSGSLRKRSVLVSVHCEGLVPG